VHSSAIWQRSDLALHREDAVDDDEDPAVVVARLLQGALQLVHPVVAKGAQLRAAEDAAVEDRGVVARVGDDGVAGREQRPQRREVRLRPRRGDERLLGPHPVGDLLLELEVQLDRPVEQARAGQAGAVRLQGRPRALDDALVGGQPEVVVGAEHDPRGALHLDDGSGGSLERAEVGQDVGRAGGGELVGALVAADLGEDVVCRGGHVA